MAQRERLLRHSNTTKAPNNQTAGQLFRGAEGSKSCPSSTSSSRFFGKEHDLQEEHGHHQKKSVLAKVKEKAKKLRHSLSKKKHSNEDFNIAPSWGVGLEDEGEKEEKEDAEYLGAPMYESERAADRYKKVAARTDKVILKNHVLASNVKAEKTTSPHKMLAQDTVAKAHGPNKKSTRAIFEPYSPNSITSLVANAKPYSQNVAATRAALPEPFSPHNTPSHHASITKSNSPNKTATRAATPESFSPHSTTSHSPVVKSHSPNKITTRIAFFEHTSPQKKTTQATFVESSSPRKTKNMRVATHEQYSPNKATIRAAAHEQFSPNKTATTAATHEQFSPTQTAMRASTHEQFSPNKTATRAANPELFSPNKTATRATASESFSSNKTTIRAASHESPSSNKTITQATNAKTLSPNKTMTEAVTEKLAPTHAAVSDATHSITSKIQGISVSNSSANRQSSSPLIATDSQSKKPGSSTEQIWDKGVSVKEYIMNKLEPGEDERALHKVISDAMSPRRAPGDVGVVEKVREAVTSLLRNEELSQYTAARTSTSPLSSQIPVSTNAQEVAEEENHGRILQAN